MEELIEYVGHYNTQLKVEAAEAKENVPSNSDAQLPSVHNDFVRMLVTDDKQSVIALCTSMMRRVHTLVLQSGELVFVDASGNMDRDNWRVFVLLTHSFSGGLPLGILFVTSESAATIQKGLELLKDMVGDMG